MNNLNIKPRMPLRVVSNVVTAMLAAVVAACSSSGNGGINRGGGPGSPPPPPPPSACTAEQYATAWETLGCPEGMLCVGEVSGNDVANISVLTSGSRPDWSPDGTQLVFERPDFPSAGMRGSIFRIDADGTGEVKLADGRDPAWSPDGSRIAFRNSDGIAVMDADGSNVAELIGPDFEPADFLSVQAPAWSPDGQRIVFELYSSAHPPQLYAMNGDGGDVRSLTPTSTALEVRDPAWSPDGGNIAFIRDRELATIDTTGSNARVIVPDIGANGRKPDWSPDGSTLSYSAQRGCLPSALFAVGYQGDTASRLLAGTQQSAWSPDGTRLAFASAVDAYPAVTRPATVYDRENFDNGGASRSRYVLYDDGAFDLQVSWLQHMSVWPGQFRIEENVVHFAFWSDNVAGEEWMATGVLDGSRMTVEYNPGAARDGFVDGVYVLSEPQP